MAAQNNCCGFNLNLTKITTFGIFTFSFPLLFLSAILFLILILPSMFNAGASALKKKLKLLIRINLDLINTALNFKARCKLSGKIFSYSPLFAGIIYKYFNLFLISFLWGAIIILFKSIVKLIH